MNKILHILQDFIHLFGFIEFYEKDFSKTTSPSRVLTTNPFSSRSIYDGLHPFFGRDADATHTHVVQSRSVSSFTWKCPYTRRSQPIGNTSLLK